MLNELRHLPDNIGPRLAGSAQAQAAVEYVAGEMRALKGKIQLLNERFDKQLAAQGNGLAAYGEAVVYRGAGPRIAASFGAAAVLVRSVGGADFRLLHTGATVYTDGVAKVPAAAVTAEDADLLANLAHQGAVKMRLVLTPQSPPPVASYDVIADRKGSEHPEQVVIVSGISIRGTREPARSMTGL